MSSRIPSGATSPAAHTCLIDDRSRPSSAATRTSWRRKLAMPITHVGRSRSMRSSTCRVDRCSGNSGYGVPPKPADHVPPNAPTMNGRFRNPTCGIGATGDAENRAATSW